MTFSQYIDAMTALQLQTISEAVAKEAVDLKRRGEQGRGRFMWELHYRLHERRIELLIKEAERIHT